MFAYSDLDYGDEIGPSADVAAVAAWVRHHGADRVTLVGASLGDRTTVTAAFLHPQLAQAVVSISAPRVVAGDDLLQRARRLRTPIVRVGSERDTFTFGGRDTRQLYRATRAEKELLLVPGRWHGNDLMREPCPCAERVIAMVERVVLQGVRARSSG